MIRVFISYCNESDGKMATSLHHYLSREEKIKSLLAPIDRETVVENAEKIANDIDICNFFIIFYTRKGKENRWINQELGYAFNHVRQNNFKIIPIFNDRNDFNGFLTSKSHNFYEGFKLNEEEPERTMEKVKNYLIEEYKHPIKLGFKIENNKFESSPDQITLKAVIWIYNHSSKKISDATLDFILPETDSRNLNLSSFESFHSLINTEYESTILPEFHNNKFTLNRHIQRSNFLLGDILGLNVYEIPVKIRIPLTFTRFSSGVYINIPLFGTTYYQTKLLKDGSDWVLDDFHCLNDNTDEKILIDYSGSD